jgi:hypothetical protein
MNCIPQQTMESCLIWRKRLLQYRYGYESSDGLVNGLHIIEKGQCNGNGVRKAASSHASKSIAQSRIAAADILIGISIWRLLVRDGGHSRCSLEILIRVAIAPYHGHEYAASVRSDYGRIGIETVSVLIFGKFLSEKLVAICG